MAMTQDSEHIFRAEVEIGRLVQRYARAVDLEGGAAVADCFTPEGYLQLSSGEPRGRTVLAESPRDASVQRRHLFTPPLIAFENDTAATGEGFCLIIEFDVATGQQRPPVMVDYHDEYRRTPEGWKLAARRITRAFR